MIFLPDYVYRYRDDLYKIVTLYAPSGRVNNRYDEVEFHGKTADNVRRAQRQIEAYSLCNDWHWFLTATLDGSKVDRTDLEGFRSCFTRLIRDLRRRCGQISFLLVPELHRSGDAWHMHGLLAGLPIEELRPFSLDERLPPYLRRKVLNGSPVFDWPAYRAAFGFCDVEPVRNRDAAARYITKYVSKGLTSSSKAIAARKHLYYPSKGLKLPERLEDVPEWLSETPSEHSYEWEYGSASWIKASPQA